MADVFTSPFMDPELRPQSFVNDGVSYHLHFGQQVREEGKWSNGWAVSWRGYSTHKTYATAIQVGTEFYFMPMFPEFEPGFKSFAEMREIVKEIEVLARKLEDERQQEFRRQQAEYEQQRKARETSP